MRRTRIKICGVCREEDAAAAARAGADAVGLVFHAASPRNVSLAIAGRIVTALPPFVSAVGLFVDADTQTIVQTARELHLRHVQLHGHERPEQAADLRGISLLQAIRVSPDSLRSDLDLWRQAMTRWGLSHLRGIVLETAATAEPGGSGKANDWETVKREMASGAFAGLPPVVAAGGLTPETVGQVVRDVRPWAVDVSSGVESAVGRKSAEKLEAFVRAVREADAA